jgi:ankyrin repeat protein
MRSAERVEEQMTGLYRSLTSRTPWARRRAKELYANYVEFRDAVQRDDAELVGALLEAGGAAKMLANHKAALITDSALGDHINILSMLVRSGMNIDASISRGVTPLHTAAWWRRAGSVRHILKLGANVNAADDLGNTALAWAAGGLNEEIVSTLLEAGGSVSPREAALLGDDDAIRAAVASGADVNTVDASGYTVLHLAASNGRLSTVGLLIEAGADVNRPLRGALFANCTPLYLAVRGWPYSAHMIPWNNYQGMTGGTGPPGFPSTDSSRCSDICRLLLRHGAVADTAKEPYDYTPIIFAVQHCDVSAVQMLLDHGADQNRETYEHTTALRLAERCGRGEIVALLKKYGAVK